VDYEGGAITIQQVNDLDNPVAGSPTIDDPFLLTSPPGKATNWISYHMLNFFNRAAVNGCMLVIPFDPPEFARRH
jgi:hypothetical protein